MNTPPTIPLLINNESVTTPNIFEVRNPAYTHTNDPIHLAAGASSHEAIQAADAAKAAFPAWSEMKPNDRRVVLERTADILVSRKEELIRYQCEETGADPVFAEATLMLGAGFLRDFGGRASTIQGVVPSVMQDGEGSMIWKMPYGVILGIAPWNAPYILGIRTVAIPLAAGNTVVLKGAELSPKCFWAIGDVFRQAGLPAGCLNVLCHRPSDASEVTSALIAHPAIRKITYTGSTRVGSIVAGLAAKYVKPVLLELGGKASAVVLEDADLERAATACTIGAFLHSGQICMSTEKIVVHRSIADQFRQVLRQTAEKFYGPHSPAPVLVAPVAVERNRALLSDATAKGASLLFGENNEGKEVNASPFAATSMRPVIVDNVAKGMDLYETESFGPTVSLITVADDAEAISVANDSDFGLTSAVFTKDIYRGIKMARKIEAGAIHINSLTIHDESTMPHGGWKGSGFGRFGGPDAFDEFLQTKTVTWVE